MTMKNVLFSLLISILIFSCGNDDKDKDKKEFKDICECMEWGRDVAEEILEMTNSEFRDEFEDEDYNSFEKYATSPVFTQEPVTINLFPVSSCNS